MEKNKRKNLQVAKKFQRLSTTPQQLNQYNSQTEEGVILASSGNAVVSTSLQPKSTKRPHFKKAYAKISSI